MIEIVYLIFLMLVSIALGQWILKLLKVSFSSYLEEFVFSLPLGLSTLAYTTFLIGIVGFLYKPVIILILAVLFVILFRDIKRCLSNIANTLKKFNSKSLINKYYIGFDFYSILIVFIVFFAIFNFVLSFTPPWHFDVLAYHLAVQKLYLNAHKIIYLPYLFFSNLPSLVDWIYLIGLVLHNGILSNLLGYSLGIVFILAIYSFCRKFFNHRIALLSSLIFYSIPMVSMLAKTAHIDVQFALFIFLAIYALFSYFSSKSNKWLALCAVFSGLGASTKIFGAAAVLGILLLLLLNMASRTASNGIGWRQFLLRLAMFGVIAIFVTSPWLLKNYFFTGNPFWPALNNIFHGKYWDENHQEDLSKMINLRKPSLANYARLPWDIHTQAGKSAGNIDEDLEIGPFLLAFLPIYLLLSKKNKIINQMLLLVFIYLSIWFFLSHVLRYVIFIMPLVAIISAYVCEELLNNFRISAILKALLVFTFSFNLIFLILSTAKELPVAIGFETKDAFYSKYPGAIYKASKFVNSNLPENSKILLFRDTRGYFLDRDYVWGDPLMQLYIDYSKFKNEDELYEELKSKGITHILANTRFSWSNVLQDVVANDYRYNKRILGLMDNLLIKHTVNIYDNEGILINRMKNE
ncbi:glycosyltransferase family 39 protein [Candidatus Woesearchaeota archaeon]|nr:glycosyltransferase family 39 protein [Candidatus Woesearchaeota archaeon]